MITDRWHISVLIPARDEEDLLPRCLESVLEARAALAANATCDIVVAVDQSIDSSFDIARKLVGTSGLVVRSDAGIVGVARAVAANAAFRRSTHARAKMWLANTDADCWVPRTWLRDQLVIADTGVEAVAGIIDVDSFEQHDPHVPQRFQSTYLLNPDGSHPHVHGANLGVRADAYLRAGGWADLRTAEDHDLWARLRATGARMLSPVHLSVLTSGRRVGRAPMGFAAALAAHNEVTLDA